MSRTCSCVHALIVAGKSVNLLPLSCALLVYYVHNREHGLVVVTLYVQRSHWL